MGETMADFEIGDIVRLGAAFLVDNTDAIVNVFHVKVLSGAPMAFAAAATAFQDYIGYIYGGTLGSYPTGFQSDRISVKNETQNTVWGSIAFGVPLVGTHVGDMTALQVALLSWARTPISRVQLRKYWGPFTEANMTAGLWLSGLRAIFQAAMDYHIQAHAMPNGLELIGVAYNKLLDRAIEAYSSTTAAVPVVQRRRRKGTGA